MYSVYIYIIGGGVSAYFCITHNHYTKNQDKKLSCLRRWTKTYHEITFIIERNQETTEKKNIHMGAAIVAGVLGYQTRFKTTYNGYPHTMDIGSYIFSLVYQMLIQCKVNKIVFLFTYQKNIFWTVLAYC